MNWSIALLGTNHPAVPTLEKLGDLGLIKLVIMPANQPEKNQDLIRCCESRSIPYSYQIKDIENFNINLIIAANYPKLVPTKYLERYPCVNTHWSDLPKYRGVHGTAWSLINGDYTIACTVHWMAEEFDTGAVIKKAYVAMDEEMTLHDLHQSLAEKQAEVLAELLQTTRETSKWPTVQQNEADATYVPQRYPEDGWIDWSWPTERIWNLVRVLPYPDYPGAFTYLNNQKLIIWSAEKVSCPEYYTTPGQIVRVIKNSGVWVKTGDTCLLIKEVQMEGSNIVRAGKILKRGMKLGINPAERISALEENIARLEEKIESLEKLSQES